MARKRGNRDGSIFRRKSDGKWIAVISVRDPASGNRRRVARVGNTREHARLLLKDLERDHRRPVSRMKVTLAEYLARWLEDDVLPNKAESTHGNYSSTVRRHVLPLLGGYRMAELAPYHVAEWQAVLLKKGASDRTRQNAYAILHRALEVAVQRELIDRNPCSKVERPKSSRSKIRPFSSTEVLAILNAVKGDRLEAVYHLALKHGMRAGEIFGLRWSDVLWDGSSIRVEQQASEVAGRVKFKPPKSKAGTRQFEVSPKTLEALHARRVLSLKEGVAGEDLVFVDRRGGVIRRSNFTARHWKRTLRRARVPHRGFHHCRHTAATAMLNAKVPVHVVSRIIGHSKPSITLDVYSHYIASDSGEAAAAVARLESSG